MTWSSSTAMKRLQFKQDLVQPSNRNRAIPTADLLVRLKMLHDELRMLDQENTDVTSLSAVAQACVSACLVHHKDEDVRCILACCIADLLRLFAPEHPFEERQLKDAFVLFVKQLKCLKNVNAPNYQFAALLLESLATVRSLVLIHDLPNVNELTMDIFEEFFDNIITYTSLAFYRDTFSAKHSKQTVAMMRDILQMLIEETQHCPMQSIQMLMHQFSRKRKTENPAAYLLAADLVKASQDALKRYVSQYFSEVLLQSKEANFDEADLVEAHEIVIELGRVSEEVLLHVIPQLETELHTDNLNMRLLATQVLGTMFCDRSSTIAKTYPNTWISWMQKRNDNEMAIRIKWLEYAMTMYKNHPEKADELNEIMVKKLYDHDERVRFNVLEMFEEFVDEQDTTMFECWSLDLLKEFGNRCKDKRATVRHVAIALLAKIFNLVYKDLVTSETSLVVNRYAWIPETILTCIFLKDVETRAIVEEVFDEFILQSSESERSERVVFVLSSLQERGLMAFMILLTNQPILKNVFLSYLEASASLNGNKSKEAITKVLAEVEIFANRLSKTFPDPSKTVANLVKFAKINDVRLAKLIAHSLKPSLSTKEYLKTKNEIVKRLESSTSNSGISRTFVMILRSAAHTFVDQNVITSMLEKIRYTDHNDSKVEQNQAETCKKILRHVSKFSPELLTTQFSKLIACVESGHPSILKDALYMLSRFTRSVSDESVWSEKMFPLFEKIVLDGSFEEAKYATTTLLMCPIYPDERKSEMIQSVFKLVKSDVPEDVARGMSAWNQLVKYKLGLVEAVDEKDEVIAYIKDGVLRYNLHCKKGGRDAWVPLVKTSPECQAKALGIKILANYLVSLHKINGIKAQTEAESIISLLIQAVEREGELTEDSSSHIYKIHIRLHAALSLLLICRVAALNKIFTNQQLQSLSVMVQDTIYEVREQFLQKLKKYLSTRSLHPRFLTMMMLIAYEPEADLKTMIKSWLSEQNGFLPEELLIRLVHLIAHSPDFSHAVEDIKQSAKYIEFFLDVIMFPENVSFLYCLATQVKAYEDIWGSSDNVYLLSEVAQKLIHDRCATHGWGLHTYPKRVRLPSDLFKIFPKESDFKAIMSKVYLPPGVFANKRIVPIKPERTEVESDGDDKDASEEDVELTKTSPIRAKPARASKSAFDVMMKASRQPASETKRRRAVTKNKDEEHEQEETQNSRKRRGGRR